MSGELSVSVEKDDQVNASVVCSGAVCKYDQVATINGMKATLELGVRCGVEMRLGLHILWICYLGAVWRVVLEGISHSEMIVRIRFLCPSRVGGVEGVPPVQVASTND